MQQILLRDTRLSVNEGMEKLNKDVRRFGKMVRTFVKFFVAFFLFTVLNLCIDVFTKHSHLLSAHTVRLLEEGLHAFINQNVHTFVSIIVERNLFAMIAAAFAGVFGVSCIAGVLATARSHDKGDDNVRNHEQFKQDCVAATSTVSYRQKVCFLS